MTNTEAELLARVQSLEEHVRGLQRENLLIAAAHDRMVHQLQRWTQRLRRLEYRWMRRAEPCHRVPIAVDEERQ